MSQSPQYELLYFPIRARAEHVRLLFHFSGTPFVDTGVTDWPSLKAKTPLGQLPIPDRSQRGDGEAELVLPQSQAIVRHLARKLNLYGENLREHRWPMCQWRRCKTSAPSLCRWPSLRAGLNP